MIYLSIVIPAYNSSKTIIPLLESIKNSKKVDFGEIEVIVVDDCSTDDTVDIGLTFLRTSQTRFTSSRKHGTREARGRGSAQKANLINGFFKFVKLRKNGGPANARNIGVKYAKGKIVLFLDADVVCFPNTIYQVLNSFKNDPDLFALTGVWDKEQKSRHFFPKFKALRDWSYWINERDPRNYYYLFSTRIASIRKDLFVRLGGFDTTYKAALVEDMELTYRIARRHAVVFNPAVKVRHEFEDFWPIAKKYFLRSYYWSRIYRERKRFDPVATTGKEALTTITAGMMVILGIFTLLSYLSNLSYLSEIILIGLVAVVAIHLFLVRKFLWFCFREEGFWFAVKAFVTGIILYIVILAGAAWSFLF